MLGNMHQSAKMLMPLTGEVKNNDHQCYVLLGNPESHYSDGYHFITQPHPNSVEDKSTPPHGSSTTQWSSLYSPLCWTPYVVTRE